MNQTLPERRADSASILRSEFRLALIGLLLLVNSGCLGAAIVAGGAAAAGGATAGWFYVRAPLYRDYPVDLDRAHLAVQAAMSEMQLPVLRRDLALDKGKITLETRLNDGNTAWISMSTEGKPIPADGIVTRVSVRVGHFFGDEEISRRILDQIGKYLAPAGPVPIQPVPLAGPVPAVPTTGPIKPVAATGPIATISTPAPLETGPPPEARPR